MKPKKKPPSRIKYEQNNPVISFRASRDVYDRLEEVKAIEGMSNADILKVSLGIIEPNVKEYGDIKQEAYAEGWKHGHRDAEMAFKLVFRCCECGQFIEVKNKEVREAAGRLLTERGWGHADCLNHKKIERDTTIYIKRNNKP